MSTSLPWTTPALSHAIAIEAVHLSPTELRLDWSYDLETPKLQFIYRDGNPVATPPLGDFSYLDSTLRPNARYEYGLVVQLEDGSTETAELSTVTLAYRPTMAGPMKVSEDGFTLAIVDERNPPDTDYRITVSDGTERFESEWGSLRCRTFEGLRRDTPYSFKLVAKNRDGIETEPASWIHNERPERAESWSTQRQTGTSDPWVIERINDIAYFYGLTESARLWLESDIRIEAVRNEPGFAGFIAPDLVRVGRITDPRTLLHEVMHGYTEHWVGFPEPCDRMNIYTFERDFARFMLEFREYDESMQGNPWENWRPFYDYFVHLSEDYLSPEGKSSWQLLAEGAYSELWGPLYHVAHADIPILVGGRLSLIPPPLRPYLEGFLAEGEATTWLTELIWYSGLSPGDRHLWDSVYGYHSIYWASQERPELGNPLRTIIPEPLRQRLRSSDRQRLVDFVNSLEDLACNSSCDELWNADFNFWTAHTEQHLARFRIYGDELGPGAGIDLSQSNWDAVRQILAMLASENFCGQSISEDAKDIVNSVADITENQRDALLQMIVVRQLKDGDSCA